MPTRERCAADDAVAPNTPSLTSVEVSGEAGDRFSWRWKFQVAEARSREIDRNRRENGSLSRVWHRPSGQVALDRPPVEPRASGDLWGGKPSQRGNSDRLPRVPAGVMVGGERPVETVEESGLALFEVVRLLADVDG